MSRPGLFGKTQTAIIFARNQSRPQLRPPQLLFCLLPSIHLRSRTPAPPPRTSLTACFTTSTGSALDGIKILLVLRGGDRNTDHAGGGRAPSRCRCVRVRPLEEHTTNDVPHPESSPCMVRRASRIRGKFHGGRYLHRRRDVLYANSYRPMHLPLPSMLRGSSLLPGMLVRNAFTSSVSRDSGIFFAIYSVHGRI
jgi:hypothetical protein